MADLHTYRKLPSDPCLSEEQITAYIDGKLSAAEQHACEAHILDCAMCEDAVEGLSLVKDRSVLAAPLKTGNAPVEGKVVLLQQHSNRRVWYAVAAVLVLVLGATFIMRMLAVSEENNLAESKARYDSVVISSPGNYRQNDGLNKQNDSLAHNAPATDRVNGPVMTMNEESFGHADEMVVVQDAPSLAPPVTIAEPEEQIAYEKASPDYKLRQTAGDDDMKSEADQDKATEGKNEAAKKKSLLDLAKSGTGIPNGNKSRSNDAYVDDARKDNASTAPASNTQATQVTQAPAKTETAVTFSTSGGYTDTTATGVTTNGFMLAEVNTVVVHADTVTVADQLELSYQNGLNLLNAGQANSAIVMFDKVLVNKKHARYEDAEFQKAKALIKAGKKEDAKVLLKSIEAKKGKHATEATDLLKTL